MKELLVEVFAMKKNHNMVLGAVFILVGTLVLLSNLGYLNFSWSYIWPMALLIPGIYMHMSFFTGLDKNPGILVPGGILTTYGVLFYANVIFGWSLMSDLWPVFLIGIALGLFELYIFGGRDKALLIPVFILGGLGLVFLTRSEFLLNKKYIVPAFLIIIGIMILSKGRKEKGFQHDEEKKDNQISETETRIDE